MADVIVKEASKFKVWFKKHWFKLHVGALGTIYSVVNYVSPHLTNPINQFIANRIMGVAWAATKALFHKIF